jgi:hypothetical protein
MLELCGKSNKRRSFMLKMLEEWKKSKERRKLLLSFYEELKKNLESYYVMDQLGRFRFFRMQTWGRIKPEADSFRNSDLETYVRRLEEYNALLDDFTKYEQWYSADINNKTPASAKILHDKREEPRQKFQGLEPVIKAALRNFEQYLLKTKILKN